MRPTTLIPITLFVAILGGLACDSDSPTAPSLAAPTIQSPAPNEIVSGGAPTLTVGNAGASAETTYAFQVGTDASLGNVVASVEGVSQGANGTTSWQVPEGLVGGAVDGEGRSTYFWRARATAGGQTSPWSPAASFRLVEGFLDGSGNGSRLVSDPLTNGASVGRVSGGDFRSDGWMATDALSYIRYEVPTLRSGFVEFDVTNLREPNPHSDKRMLMIMWDPSRGDYTTNPFRVHLQKLDKRTVDWGTVRMRWISRGQERNIYHDRTDWRPDEIYHFRMEWGDFPNIDTQWVRVLFDGQEILTANYDLIYEPSPHWIELGGAPRHETLEQAVFSNVRIGRR